MVGVDDSETSRSALLYAAGVAEGRSAELVVAHVPPYPFWLGLPSPISPAGLVHRTQRERVRRLEERVGTLLDLTDVPWRFVTLEAPVASALRDLAQRLDAELVVVGTPRRSFVRRLGHVLVPSVPRLLTHLGQDRAVTVA